MNRMLMAAALVGGLSLVPSPPAWAATRHYDCSKPGNANKAVCKVAATPSKPVVKQTSVQTATRHYDCTKPGNANKAQCKTSAAAHQSASRPVAESRPVAVPAARPAGRTATVANDNNRAGATAQCKDGTYSHAKEHRGACSHHGGVAKWL